MTTTELIESIGFLMILTGLTITMMAM